MNAFHGDLATKAALIRQLTAHAAAKELAPASQRWDGQIGTVSGCMLHEADLTSWGARTGLPTALAHILDLVTGALAPVEAGVAFALYWLSIVEVGANLDRLPASLIAYLLGDAEYGVIQYAAEGKAADISRSIVALHARVAQGVPPTEDEWRAARADAMKVTDSCDGLPRLVGECVEASGWDLLTAPAVVNDVLGLWLRIMDDVSRRRFLDDPVRAAVKAKLDSIHPSFLKIKSLQPDRKLDLFDFLKESAPEYHDMIRYNPHVKFIRNALIQLTVAY